MFLAIDTCSWLRLRDLYEQAQLDLRLILTQFRLADTLNLRRERQNYGVEAFVGGDLVFFPLPEAERTGFIVKFLLDEFDAADQDLFILGKRDRMAIITDDRDLFYHCASMGLSVLQLWAFCLKLVADERLPKHDFVQCAHQWIKDKHYSQQVLKVIKKHLNAL